MVWPISSMLPEMPALMNRARMAGINGGTGFRGTLTDVKSSMKVKY